MSFEEKRRLRLTNGYKIDFDQIARLLTTACADTRSRIPAHDLASSVGVSDTHTQFICTIAAAIGLLVPKTYRPTPLGETVHTGDLFCDDLGTLWFLHYVAASNEQNSVWNRLANLVVPGQRCFGRKHLSAQLEDLRDQFTVSSFTPYVNKEMRSLLNAYTHQNFARLAYLLPDGEDRYTLGYREPVPPLVLAACIVRFRDTHRPGDTALSIRDLLEAPNSPGVVCQIPEDRLRAGLEALKTQSGMSLESRADLDQVRLRDDTRDHQWMERYYEGRD